MLKLEKITKFLLGALLFLLPWQTILILQENFINGAKWQYGTVGFYATEIIFWLTVLFFNFWFQQKKKQSAKETKFNFTEDRLFLFFCLLFVVYSLLSKTWALSPTIAFEHARHIMEAVILFIMIFAGPLNFKEAVLSLTSGAVLQSLLGIFQFFTQSTFDYKWLGLVAHPGWEAGSSIVASDEIGRWVRAYGSFSHPNILGGYLTISLVLLFSLSLKIHKISTSYWLKFIILFSALFFTFSRSAWIAFGIFLSTIFIYGLKNKDKKIISLSSLFLLIITALSIIYFPVIQTRLFPASNNEISSVTERISGTREAWQIFKQHPFLGVGAGNYTVASYKLNPTLPGYDYQPVHNVFLLLLTELGIFGAIILLSTFAACINILRNNIMPRFYFLLGIFIILMMFDHYLFSFYAGLMLSAVYLGLICRPKHNEPHT